MGHGAVSYTHLQDGTNNILLQNPNDINPNLYLRGTYTQLENVDPMRP